MILAHSFVQVLQISECTQKTDCGQGSRYIYISICVYIYIYRGMFQYMHICMYTYTYIYVNKNGDIHMLE